MERSKTENDAERDELSERRLDQLLRQAHSRFDPAFARIRRPGARVALFDSSIGQLLAAESPRGLVALRFIDTESVAATLELLRRHFDLAEEDALGAEIGAEIERLMHGEADAIAARQIDLTLVESAFQRRALLRLRQIPAGSVVTYQALAAAAGAPSGQRAIGNTVASNPLPIYVPCHRVIRSDGLIGNYGGGPDRKLKLLRAEGFRVGPERRVPPGAVYGHRSSRIFCRPDCSAVRRSDRTKWIIFCDPERARSCGMRACKLCHPA